MHRQIWRAAVPLLLLAAVCGALWPLRRFLTAEAISRASPKQLWLAAGSTASRASPSAFPCRR